MSAFQRSKVPPLPSARSVTALLRSQQRLSLTTKAASQASSRVSPASARGLSPLGAPTDTSSITEGKPSRRSSPIDFEERTSELLRGHIRIGNRIDFRAMSSAAKVSRSRLLESKCRKALEEMQAKERRDTRLPLRLQDENTTDRDFPCPLRDIISLRGKVDMRLQNSFLRARNALRFPATSKPRVSLLPVGASRV